MHYASLSFFEARGFHTFISSDAYNDAFCHTKQVDSKIYRVFHLINKETYEETIWMLESKLFHSIIDFANEYPELNNIPQQLAK